MRLRDAAHARMGQPGPRCGVAEALDDLGDELQEALDDLSITGTALEDALSERGYTISEYTLRRHRNGRCRC